MNTHKQDTIELSLCPVCASQFYQSNKHTIRRSRPLQTEKELCTYCGLRYGWDFQIIRKQKVRRDVTVNG